MEKLKDTLNDLSLTNEEVKKLSEAFKKEEFRKLFREYAEELQDPENKKKYEEELTAMENERGMDVEFINPVPGHVLKTIQNSEKKVFINICQSDKIEKPTVNKTNKGDLQGATWSIPHSFAPPREDLDKKRESCLVYDVVFNVNAYQMGSKNPRFRKMLHDTALEGIENMFKVNLDKINFKILKLKMKGIPVATVIRKKRSDFQEKQASLNSQEDDPLKFPYPDVTETMKTEYDIKASTQGNSKTSEFVKPIYKIKYSNNFEIMNYIGEDIKQPTRPDKMIIEIKLPMISSANCVDLDIEKQHLKLTSVKPVKYLLEIKLAYPIITDLGSAKFDKSNKTLKLELPIEQVPKPIQHINSDNDGDIHNSLIEEQSVESNENEVENPDSGNIEFEPNEYQPDLCSPSNTSAEALEPVTTKDIERIIPQIDIKFRKNSTRAFLLCDIRNIDKTSCEIQYEYSIDGEQQAIVNFSNCGQGGWKNFYQIPLILNTKHKINDFKNSIQCLISEENMVIQVPLQIDSQQVESISFHNQIFNCEFEEVISNWNELHAQELSENVDNNEETFNAVHGMLNMETLKIICTPLEYIVDLKKEFPLICDDNHDITNSSIESSNKTQEEEQKISTQSTLENTTDKENDEITNNDIEVIKEILEEEKDISRQSIINTGGPLVQSHSALQETTSTIISSDYFENKRNLEHRTKCAVELSSSLLFDLE